MKQNFTLTFLALMGFSQFAQSQSQQLDPTFATGGIAVTAVSVDADAAGGVAIQTDQKIVSVGQAKIGGVTQFALVRYNPDGTLDNTFGTNGIVNTVIGATSGAAAVAIQSDGKILAGGYTFSSAADFAVARYNADGTLDNAFGTNGIAIASIGTGNDFPRAMVLQPDGKIVLAGRSVLSGTITAFALARFNPDGSLDNGFSSDGVLTTIFGTNANDYSDAFAIELQSDGKIVATGDYTPNGGPIDGIPLARYNTDGSLDATFGTGGQTVTHIATYFNIGKDLIVLPNDQIIVVSEGRQTSGGNYDAVLLRFSADGVPDNTFGNGGVVPADFFGADDRPTNLLLQNDGKIYVAGYTRSNPTAILPDGFVARFLPNGSLDNTWGTNGSLYTNVASLSSTTNGLALQADGKLVGVGNSNPGATSDFFAVRYEANGAGPITPLAPTNLTASVFKTQSSYVDLNWIDNSSNELGFVIERSLDGIAFSPIDSVVTNISQYLDYALAPLTTYYYRVYAFNTSGNSANTNVEQITTDNSVGIADAKDFDIKIFPNPVSAMLAVCFPAIANRTIGIQNALGQTLAKFTSTKNTAVLPVDELPSGVYTLIIQNGNAQTHQKFVKE
jgi:uncharacterized delta-60 repeat protein